MIQMRTVAFLLADVRFIIAFGRSSLPARRHECFGARAWRALTLLCRTICCCVVL